MYGHASVCFSFPCGWAASFGPGQMKPPWTFASRSPGGHVLSLPVGWYLGAAWLVSVCFTFLETAHCFLRGLYHFHSLQQHGEFQHLHSGPGASVLSCFTLSGLHRVGWRRLLPCGGLTWRGVGGRSFHAGAPPRPLCVIRREFLMTVLIYFP